MQKYTFIAKKQNIFFGFSKVGVANFTFPFFDRLEVILSPKAKPSPLINL